MLAAALLLFAQDAVADAPLPSLAARVARAPARVQAFVERRTGCNHWGGEEPYDADRRREIEAAVRDLRCDAIERDEVALRRRYRGDAEILSLLAAVSDEPGL